MKHKDTNIETSEGMSQKSYPRLMRAATYASVIIASILILIKLGGWFATNSLSLLATSIDSILDFGASIVNLIAIRHALQPADKEHRFGHGKAEALASLAQAAFIAGSGIFLFLESVERFLEPRVVHNTDIGIGIMVVAIILTAMLVGFQDYVVNKNNSIALQKDSTNFSVEPYKSSKKSIIFVLQAIWGKKIDGRCP